MPACVAAFAMCALNLVRKGAARAARKIRASKRALCRLGFCDVAIAAAKIAPPASEFESAGASPARRRYSLFLNSSRL
jgi:phosphohistidine phosphatase SixA